ncbi:MAG: riboflavin biosynthesis protein RibF [Planctomycetota bacterium]|jgi:riboflavin kinase/FMN adenylyltransferase
MSDHAAMRRHTGVEDLSPAGFRRPVATVGVFDGMHRGHLHVIEHLRAMADGLGGEAVVLTFDTHPRAVIQGAAPRKVLSLAHRLLLLERLGVDATVVLPFDDAFRHLDYRQFTKDILVARLGIIGLLFGYNGAFGHDAKGTAESVSPLGHAHGFEVREAPPITLHGAPISTSRIRDAIEAGELAVAAEMLGRPTALYGKVVMGDGRGRTIGFPTANLDPEGEILPPRGVYQVVATLRGERYAAVANVGLRPTFVAGHTAPEPLLEVHIPGVDFDFYGERVEVELVRKIREERKFPSREALIRQIREDVASLGS